MNKVVLLGAATVALVALAARRVEPPRIAVIDMSRLVRDHVQSKSELEMLEQWKDATEKLLDERQKAYNAEVDGLEQFKPDSEEARRKAHELRVKKFDLEQQVNAYKEDRERRRAKAIADSHARVVAACRTYLDTHDLDAVLQFASTPVSGMTSNEVIPEIVVRTVVAYRKTIDVTDAVLAILDAQK
jgi:Skp family chaperone for outer membrane proteins